ncbi:MmgE/PrpD family protein [Curvibacter sp. HBC61]|uniref:MmgE/PrpD family protein n=1 Tax=Curvibacter cyanobacteriorum TaxID=3026422 RepID=A0ABT5N1E4_9BURK|nr:MmgE/PrpD family protein [Curvibacter sp. HBC61]MDD0839878.1 MmgE/PrpD family protein [Curvibacter sp. HBC61]
MTLTPSTAPVAEQVARWAHGLRLDQVPIDVRTRACHLMLDALGIGLASTRYAFARQASAAIDALAGPGGTVPVLGRAQRLPLRDAAMLNGLLIHGLDYDDTHPRGVVHATTSVLPAALALAAHQGRSGAELLTSYLIGMELTTRLGAAAGGLFHQVGFHPTGLVGTFGCALAAGRLLGLEVPQLSHAQGVALSVASGNLEFLQDGAGTKRLHPGWAAAAGISAAMFAAHGMSGPRASYEGRYGLYASHLGARASEADLGQITAGLGQVWELCNVAVKPLPACHFTHACTDAASALSAAWGGAPLRRIRARLPAGAMAVVCEPIENKRRPQNPYDAQFSIPYTVATALRHGRFTLDALEPAAIADPDTLALAALVECEVDPDADFPRYYPGELVLELADGRELRHREPINRGAPGRPISNADIVTKFIDNATRSVPLAHAQRLQHAVLNLAQGQAAELAELLATEFPAPVRP